MEGFGNLIGFNPELVTLIMYRFNNFYDANVNAGSDSPVSGVKQN
tara:strand:- start:176216 stop:176350 length:135 start_codon:yes stop_codon:yes gene_type:complete